MVRRLLSLATAGALALLAQPPRFEVASIKPHDPNAMSRRLQMEPDRLAMGGTLRLLIMQAYDVHKDQVEGGPPWAQTDSYDVQAKAPRASTKAELRAMLQTLLADRFQLKLRRETRTVAGYILSVDKGGPKLPPPKEGVAPDSLGRIELGGGEIWAEAATLKNLANGLRLELQQQVIDQTNIEGHYDFKIRFDENNRELAGNPDTASLAPSDSKGSIFTALRDLGLRLDARKVPLEVFVIEQAQRPSDN